MSGTRPRSQAYPKQGTMTIADGVTYPIRRAGSFLNVLSADADFKIVLDGTDEFIGQNNRKIHLADGDKFSRIDIVNDSGGALTFQVEIGEGDISTDSTSIVGAVDVAASDNIRDVADVSLPAAATTLVSAAAADRKALMLVNAITNTKTFRIGASTAGAARGVELPPGASVTLDTKGAAYAYNPAGAVESIQVLELFNT